jgi:hypothetical protein
MMMNYPILMVNYAERKDEIAVALLLLTFRTGEGMNTEVAQ